MSILGNVEGEERRVRFFSGRNGLRNKVDHADDPIDDPYENGASL
jgi:hypothetical protein